MVASWEQIDLAVQESQFSQGGKGCGGWRTLACTCTAMPAWGPGRKWWARLTRSSRMRLGRSCWCSLLATARLGSATTQLASRVSACAFKACAITHTRIFNTVTLSIRRLCKQISWELVHLYIPESNVSEDCMSLYTGKLSEHATLKTGHSCYLQGMCQHAKSMLVQPLGCWLLDQQVCGLMPCQRGPSQLIIMHG